MFPTWTDGFIDSFLMIQSQHLFTVPCAENVLRRNQYKLAWICDTPTQYLAARTFLDEEHSLPKSIPQYDGVVFSLGTIAGNKIVIAVSLYRENSTLTARFVLSDVLLYFPGIKVSLLVGLGGGMPSPRHDIRLGDVVVGTTQTGQNTVFEYDLDYTIQEGKFQDIYFMHHLPELLQKAVASLNPMYGSTPYDYDLYKGEGETFRGTINRQVQLFSDFHKKYKRPSSLTDKFFFASFNKYSNPRTEQLPDEDKGIEEPPRVHYGLITSSDQHVQGCSTRDLLTRDSDVLCFDREAASIIDYPCLVIRGICQYLDSDSDPDKTWKIWQDYAAITAATYANEILKALPPLDIGDAEDPDTYIL
ncbi:hypothetical protein ACHAO4_007134 [Trichoderma viride]